MDANGDPLAGGLVYTYAAGTLTPQATFTSYALTQPNTNPVVLDERGEAFIWMTDTPYRVIVRTADDITIYDSDNLNRMNAAGITFDYSATYQPGTLGKWLQDLALSTGATFVGTVASGAGATTRTVQDKTRDIVSVFDWLTDAQRADVRARTGALGAALAVALNAAVPAAIAAGATDIWFPSGSYVINNTSGLVTVDPVVLRGGGPQKTIIRQTNSAGDGVSFAYPTLKQGGGIVGMTVEAGAGWQSGGFQGVGSTGVGIQLQNANDVFLSQNISVNNFDYSITVKGCYQSTWENFRCLYFTQRGIQVDVSPTDGTIGAGNRFAFGKVSNFGFAGTASGSFGVELRAGGGDFFGPFIDITGCGSGWVIKPPTGQQVLYASFTECYGDTSVFDNWVFDGTDGKVWATTCTACWAAFAAGGAGIKTLGSQLDGLQWNGGNLRENGHQGWIHSGGSNVYLDGVFVMSNGKAASNTYPGVQIAGGVSDWAVTNCRIGNGMSSLTTQAEGIKIDAGLSQNFVISNCNLTAPGSGKVPIANGSSLLNWEISGNLPKLAVGTNTSDALPVTGTQTSTIAATFARTKASRSAVISEFSVTAGAAPGGGNAFIYTVWVNGVAQPMTGTMSGSDTTLTVTANPVPITKGDIYELRLTNTGSPSTTDHVWYVLGEP